MVSDVPSEPLEASQLLTMCRAELSAVIARLMFLEASGSGRKELKR